MRKNNNTIDFIKVICTFFINNLKNKLTMNINIFILNEKRKSNIISTICEWCTLYMFFKPYIIEIVNYVSEIGIL